MSRIDYKPTKYPNPHQAEMLKSWNTNNIGGTSYKNKVTFNNGATIVVEDDKGAMKLAEAIIHKARLIYRAAYSYIMRCGDPRDKVYKSAKREINDIEKWIKQSRIIASVSDPNDVIAWFREDAKNAYGEEKLK